MSRLVQKIKKQIEERLVLDYGIRPRSGWLDDLLEEAERINKAIEQLECEGDWCGKSPHGTPGTKNYDNGLCSVCKLQKNIFIRKLEGK